MPINLLFLCTGNSARSLIAEGVLRQLGGRAFNAFSAGSHPTGKPNPHAIAVLRQHDIDTGFARSKSYDEFAGADAPKLDIPTKPELASLPRSPNNHLSQLSLTPASIAILTCLPPGRMRLRYLSSCFSNSSMQGIDTTLVPIPSLCNFSLAVSASETSDPEAINITCRFPSASAKI